MADLNVIAQGATGPQTLSPTVGGGGGDRAKAYKTVTSPAMAGVLADEQSTDQAALVGAQIRNPGTKRWSARLWDVGGGVSVLATVMDEIIEVVTNTAGVCTAFSRTIKDHSANVIQTMLVHAHDASEAIIDPDGDYHGITTKDTIGGILGAWRVIGGATPRPVIDCNTTATSGTGLRAFVRFSTDPHLAADVLDEVNADGDALVRVYGDGAREWGMPALYGGGEKEDLPALNVADAAAHVIWESAVIPANNIVAVEARVLGGKTTANAWADWDLRATFVRAAGNLAQLGPQEDLYENPNNPPLWDAYFVANAGTNTIELYVIGENATNFKARVKRFRVAVG